MSNLFTMRLSPEDEKALMDCKRKLNLKTKADVIRYFINNDIDFYKMKEDIRITKLLLMQFYGEMSYKEFDPTARNNEKVKNFFNDINK